MEPTTCRSTDEDERTVFTRMSFCKKVETQYFRQLSVGSGEVGGVVSPSYFKWGGVGRRVSSTNLFRNSVVLLGQVETVRHGVSSLNSVWNSVDSLLHVSGRGFL